LPLQVSELAVLDEYVESSPSARIYFRHDNDRLTIVAGMLSWVGTLQRTEMEEWLRWLEDHKAIEVKSFREIRDLFS
jgi:hypothetical protein